MLIGTLAACTTPTLQAKGDTAPLEFEETRPSVERPQHALALLGGVVSFTDGKSRSELVPAKPAVALVLRLEDQPLTNLGLLMDISGSWGQSRLELVPGSHVPFGYTQLSLGLGLPYLWRWERLSLYAGPRVAALYLRRSFQMEAFSGAQQYLTASPGVVGGMVLSLGERLEVLAQAQLMFTYVVMDGQGQTVGLTGGWAGMGYHF
ncbi:hypothetical protein [Hyalangium versicolor]|uniref:hypothetical protein n=1 Tax=Hyalangium versicolor TaxID=2861190 RepID=UPI001CCF6876|nr:hypothetical protein [Hyalangium versicolor]